MAFPAMISLLVFHFRSPDGVASKSTGNGNSSSDENVTDQFAKSDRNTLKKLRQQQQQQQSHVGGNHVVNESDANEIVAVRRNVIQGKVTPKSVSPSSSERTTQK